ncbi:hypothetical protein ACWDNI_20080 [Nocardia niigatensis]
MPWEPVDLADQGLFIIGGVDGSNRQVITELIPAIPRWIVVNVMIHRCRRGAFRRWRTSEFTSSGTTATGWSGSPNDPALVRGTVTLL